MPGTEFFGKEETEGVNEVLTTGCLFRYNHDELRRGIWKARELEAEECGFTGAGYAHAVSSGYPAVSVGRVGTGAGGWSKAEGRVAGRLWLCKLPHNGVPWMETARRDWSAISIPESVLVHSRMACSNASGLIWLSRLV